MKLKISFSVFILLFISTVSAFAQDQPCTGNDDDAYCPLDTWVIVLVIVLSLFAAFRLYHRGKSINQSTR